MHNESSASIFQVISNVIATAAKLPIEQVKPENPVTGLQNVDSVVLLEIIARVEVMLDIDIDEQLLFDIQTVQDFVTVCEDLVGPKKASVA